MNFHDVESTGVWVHYELNVAQEITDNLPGVDAGQVAKAKVQLFSYCNGT